MTLTGDQVATIRKQRGWSQQYLAIQSGVNKAYISEYETGVRDSLPPAMAEQLRTALLTEPAGRTNPSIERHGGRLRLVLRDQNGVPYVPPVASVQWTEEGGGTYTMFLGDVGAD